MESLRHTEQEAQLEQVIESRAYERVLVLQRLKEHFHVESHEHDWVHYIRSGKAQLANATTIGVEVEVRFSSYFPRVFDKYKLGSRPYSALSARQQANFIKDITPLEAKLLPMLEKTVELGVPKGKDRYWEFALQPAYHPNVIAEELELLRRANLIPMNQHHSLHITLGGLPKGKDAGMLLMVMELLGCSSHQRIMSGVDPDRAVSWGRRGRAGMRERSTDLAYGTTVAVEFRTLELQPTYQFTQFMLYVIWYLAECIRRPDMRHIWEIVLAEAMKLVQHLDVSTNWGRGYENVDKWSKLADTLFNVDSLPLRRLIEGLIADQEMTTNDTLYFNPGLRWW